MAKKVQLSALKVKSFVVPMTAQEQKTAKGGLFGFNDIGGKIAFRRINEGPFTEHKSQRSERGFKVSRQIR